MKRLTGVLAVTVLAGALVACAANAGSDETVTVSSTIIEEESVTTEADFTAKAEMVHMDADRTYSLSDGEDIIIDSAGIYEISGTSENSAIIVDAGDDDEVTVAY